ncbi:hypothetical protein J7K60_03550 [Candidatus Bipolaricaulota bacterium]|nr:hypothetical protein [Candidatus Bipolaricaulota bacterium]
MALTRTQIYLEPEQHRLLKKEAEAKGISLAELLRQMAWEHLRAEPTRNDFLSIVALGKSGKRSISEEHDRYIAEVMSGD